MKIINGIDLGKLAGLDPFNIAFIGRNDAAGEFFGFEKQYYVSSALDRKLLDTDQFGPDNVQTGFFLHFPDNCINKGFSGLDVTARQRVPLPVFFNAVLKKDSAAILYQAQNGKFNVFSLMFHSFTIIFPNDPLKELYIPSQFFDISKKQPATAVTGCWSINDIGYQITLP